MAALSKHYAEIVAQLNCTEIFHPGRNCGQYARENFGKIFQLCAKFYTPIVLASYARSGNKLDANTLKEFFQMLLQLTFSTYMGSAVGQSLSCVFYQTVGFPHPLFLVFLPGAIGNIWGFIAPPKIYGLITNGLWMMIFEALYRLDDVLLLSTINRSALIRTLMFMSMSQFILSSQLKLKSDVFWFIKSSPIPSPDAKPRPHLNGTPTQVHICAHSASCGEHIYRGALMNFKIGLGIEVVRMLLANISLLQRSPLQMFGKLMGIKMGMIVFLVGYTTIYRATCCALNRRQQRRTEWSQSVAAFVSGAAYFSYPNHAVLAHATISSIKLLWARYVSLSKEDDVQQQKLNAEDGALEAWMQMRRLANRMPMGKFFYVMSVGIVFHMRTFYPWMCPSLLLKAVQYTSGMNADQSMLRWSDILMGFKPPPMPHLKA